MGCCQLILVLTIVAISLNGVLSIKCFVCQNGVGADENEVSTFIANQDEDQCENSQLLDFPDIRFCQTLGRKNSEGKWGIIKGARQLGRQFSKDDKSQYCFENMNNRIHCHCSHDGCNEESLSQQMNNYGFHNYDTVIANIAQNKLKRRK